MVGFMKKMFRGMETPAEEKKEAKALKSGKITPKQYVAGEKAEGHGAGAAKKAAAIKSGKVSPAKYAAEHATKKMAGGGCTGKPKKMAVGGLSVRPGVATGVGKPAPMTPARSAIEQAVGRGGGKPAPAPVLIPKPSPSKPKLNPATTGGGKPSPVSMARKAKGGSIRGCGVAVKGTTKGKMV